MRAFLRKRKEAREQAKNLLTLELSEMEEISEKIFARLDGKIRELSAIEARLDEKITILGELLQRAGAVPPPREGGIDDRSAEVRKLAGKGLKVDEIASILDIPKGEVELILSLGR